MRVLSENPDIAGGALGQRFSEERGGLLLIEMLNDARATLGGCSFGDQCQFYRRQAALAWGGFPAFPLMEDVELALRMLVSGRVVLLGDSVISSARQWKRGTFFARVFLILRLVVLYRWSRISGRDITDKLYAIYYGKERMSS